MFHCLYKVIFLWGVVNVLDNINPNWVTGFSDAESSFVLGIYASESRSSGWRVAPEFKITLHTRDEFVLEKLQAFFGVGVINKYMNTVNYKVRKFEDICNIIIPHFSNFPLLTQKRADFELFKQGVLYLKDREFLSLSLDDIKYLTSLKASIGRGS